MHFSFTGPPSLRETVALARIAQPLLTHRGGFGTPEDRRLDEQVFGPDWAEDNAIKFGRAMRRLCDLRLFPATSAVIDARTAPMYISQVSPRRSQEPTRTEHIGELFRFGTRIGLTNAGVATPDNGWDEAPLSHIRDFADMIINPANLDRMRTASHSRIRRIAADIATTWTNAMDPNQDSRLTTAVIDGFHTGRMTGYFAIHRYYDGLI